MGKIWNGSDCFRCGAMDHWVRDCRQRQSCFVRLATTRGAEVDGRIPIWRSGGSGRVQEGCMSTETHTHHCMQDQQDVQYMSTDDLHCTGRISYERRLLEFEELWFNEANTTPTLKGEVLLWNERFCMLKVPCCEEVETPRGNRWYHTCVQLIVGCRCNSSVS